MTMFCCCYRAVVVSVVAAVVASVVAAAVVSPLHGQPNSVLE